MPETVSSAMTVLVVRHLEGSDPPSFQVMRLSDAKTSTPATVLSPAGFPLKDRPHSDLLQELRWYLESFLDYPFPPETERAERVLEALRGWGQQAFRELFRDSTTWRMFDAASRNYSKLHLQIRSDDPRVLAWPWEALCDPEQGNFLAQTCQLERRLEKPRDPGELPGSLPHDRVNILLVVARPYGQRDVRFRSVARPLVELIEKQKLPARVEMLRPPTFDRLREHLRQRPGFYHILHFDGHGAYGSQGAPGGSSHTFHGPEGCLVFETEDGTPDEVTAEKLSGLLKECAVPGVVLNACQSAMVSGESGDPFSSVAMALLRSGMRDVVAMAYSLYVSGAQQFLPAFYRRLFEAGDMAEAVRAGRQQMWQQDKRVCARGEYPLQDWLLPVLYRQDPLNFAFAKEAHTEGRESKLPEELWRARGMYGFIGRDSALLALERALRRAPAGILIQGLGGVGKTTLARGFLEWLDQTGGLEYPPFWFSFQDIQAAEYVFNRMGEALFGGNFATAALEERIKALVRALRKHRFVLVWDNFESAAGIAGTSITANLSPEDRKLLARFLDELRGGASKVILTSRSPEDWLGPQRRFLLALGGLDGEERWEYCGAILRDLGLTINRDDKDLTELMEQLGGHPLAMRTVLPRLERLSAGQVLKALRTNFESLRIGKGGDEEQARLYATLAFVEESLPAPLRPLLTVVGMHEGYVDADHIEYMAREVDQSWSRPQIDDLMRSLGGAGLVRDLEQSIFEMHPLLTSYLRSRAVAEGPADYDKWARAFVDIMAELANQLAPKELHEQRGMFHLHSQNFHHALAEAERLAMPDAAMALLQSLAVFAQNARNFLAAQGWFERLAAYGESAGDAQTQALAWHQLGMIAEEQRDLAGAEQWYRKSLAIKEKQANERGTASTYHQLGRIAEEQRDFAAAEQWYRRSLAIKEKHGDERGTATSYGQLGRLAQEQRDFAAAEQWYRKSLAISEKLRDEHTAALTQHNLGMIAQEQGDLAAAEEWYRKSVAIKEEQGDEHGAGNTYHQLGTNAQEQGDFAAAEQWYRKSLAIKEKQGNEQGAALTCGQLGVLARQRGKLLESGEWLLKSLVVFARLQDQHWSSISLKNFKATYDKASRPEQEALKAMWNKAGLGDLTNDQQNDSGSH